MDEAKLPASGEKQAFSLVDSVIECYELTDEEVEAAASAGLLPNGFTAIRAPELPSKPDVVAERPERLPGGSESDESAGTEPLFASAAGDRHFDGSAGNLASGTPDAADASARDVGTAGAGSRGAGAHDANTPYSVSGRDASTPDAAGAGPRDAGTPDAAGTGTHDAGADSAHARPAQNPLRRLAEDLDAKTDGRLRAHKWQVAACLAAVGIVCVGLPLGYAAGWGAADGQARAGSGLVALETTVDPADRAKRDANVAARYEAMGIDFSSADRIPGDEIKPITVYPVDAEPVGEVQRVSGVDVSPGTAMVLDVPLVNQLDDADGGHSLMAGCEVASLAMLLQNSGVPVTKEQLQDAIPTVPLVNEEGLAGNPNFAFVGEMDGTEHGVGYSVYHAPIVDLANRYLTNRSFKAFDLTGQPFTTMLKEVANGNPCWVITTTSMGPDLMLETWQTAEGPVDINWALHSVVLTGFDDQNVFINDPYGYDQNVPYERTAFEEAWKLMGSQCVVIVPVG